MWVIFERAKNSDSVLNSAIAWYTQGPYCHCELMFEGDVCFSSAACYGGTSFHPLTDGEQYDTFYLPTTEEQDNAIKQWCLSELGCKYDYLGVLAFILPLKPSKTRWFCSEICVAALKIIGIFLKMDAYRTSPNALAVAIQGFLEGTRWPIRYAG